ncbi:MAG: hypothetical protein CL572_05160 [Alphaproteobacteria bacterium]|nr:hypothetical protein [Alphaproteobacteria bacterium]
MLVIYLFFLIFLFNKNLNADEIHFADSHGPITVMGDHIHKKNEFMFSLRFSKMLMSDMLSGTKKISTNSVMSAPNGASDGSGRYMNSPLTMRMNMYMFGAMYAPTNNLTLMVMSSYNQKEMISQRMAMAGGAKFDVNSSGVGDTRFSGLFKIFNNDFFKTHFALGLSLPTGSIDERDTTPSSLSSRLGYKMQNGSGTFDPFFVLNNVNNFGKIKIGEQFHIKKPIFGDNSNGYHYGMSIDSSIWISYRWIENFSTSFKINYNYLGKMNGHDDEMNKRMNPAMDSKNIGHQKYNISFGLNYVNSNDFFKNHRLAFELVLPIHEKIRGIQMSDDYKIMLGWQYSFKGL